MWLTGSTVGCVTELQYSRPYFKQFPSFGAINQYESKAGSNFHSLQGMIRTSNFHGLSAQAAYTYGHSLDNVSGTRGFAPQNSLNLAGEYGNADFDTRHTFNAYAVYEVPKFTEHWKPLTSGWQGNVFTTFYTGKPINIKTSTNNSGVGEFQDRAVRSQIRTRLRTRWFAALQLLEHMCSGSHLLPMRYLQREPSAACIVTTAVGRALGRWMLRW